MTNRELDYRVAEEVMGWVRHEKKFRNRGYVYYRPKIRTIRDRINYYDDRFSTSWEAVRNMEDKLRSKGLMRVYANLLANMIGNNTVTIIYAKPRARCFAALQAK